MKITTDWLSSAIRAFIAILNRCLNETTFVEDRRLNADDLAAANAWLTRLGAGESPDARGNRGQTTIKRVVIERG